MNRLILFIVGMILCGLLVHDLHAQNLRIFGYTQNMFQVTDYTQLDGNVAVGGIQRTSNSFIAQQTNIFLANRFSRDLDGFVNVEFINNQNIRSDFGSISLDEVWLRYKPGKKFSVRVGQLLPDFGALNHQRNRTPLLPFAARPVMHENLYGELFNPEKFVPLYAFLQAAYKTDITEKVSARFTAFLGNPERSFQVRAEDLGQNSGNFDASGIDSTKFVTVGGKFQLQYSDFNFGTLQIGISAALDEERLPDNFSPIPSNFGAAGTAPRTRIMVDLNLVTERIDIIGEYGWSTLDLSSRQKQLAGGLYLPNETSYWGFINGTYKFQNGIYAMARAERIRIGESIRYKKPYITLGGGLGYRYNNVVLKTEYVNMSVDNGGLVPGVDELVNINVFRTAVGFTF